MYGESDDRTRTPRDERALYGEPCHEDGPSCDEQTLYGEPQHETNEVRELPDLELLFARMRVETTAGPTVASLPGDPPTAETTEQ